VGDGIIVNFVSACSRSSKVNKFAANRNRVCDFLLVRNSNFSPILHRFGDLIGFMCPYLTLILGVFPLHQIAHVGVSQSRGLKLFGREIIFEEFQPCENHTSTSQTDGQTDRRLTVASPRSTLASRGKN